MLGARKPRRLNEAIAVSLEDLVPRDHFYRHLEATLDLSFVRDWTRECYADRGRPSIDPVVFFKLQLVMFFEGIRSERKLIETASLNLAHRWYLGYALDEDLPDHSSLTRIRQRLGVEIFQRFFEQVVDLCQGAGLVWGKELYFDATKVEAHAGIPSLVPRFYYEAKTHLSDLFTSELTEDDEQSATNMNDLPAGIIRLPSEFDAAPGPSETDPPWRLLEERRLDPNRPSHRGYQRTSDFRVSPTRPRHDLRVTGGEDRWPILVPVAGPPCSFPVIRPPDLPHRRRAAPAAHPGAASAACDREPGVEPASMPRLPMRSGMAGVSCDQWRRTGAR
jgi:transposase